MNQIRNLSKDEQLSLMPQNEVKPESSFVDVDMTAKVAQGSAYRALKSSPFEQAAEEISNGLPLHINKNPSGFAISESWRGHEILLG